MFQDREIISRLEELKAALAPTAGTTVGLIESYVALEHELGISGLTDLVNAHPQAFPVWQSNGQHSVQPIDTYELKARLIPAWGDICRRLKALATLETTYLGLVLRWPDWQKDYKSKGLGLDNCPGIDRVLVLAEQYGKRSDLVPSAAMFHGLRGVFDYDGNYGVFVAAVPSREAFDLFRIGYSMPCLKDDRKVVPPEWVLGLTEAPTQRDKDLISTLLRVYWRRLRDQYGYEAKRDKDGPLGSMMYPNRNHGQDPLTGDIPTRLRLPDKVSGPDLPQEVQLLGSCSVGELLENWHVASKVARIIQAHRDKANPLNLELPAPMYLGRGIRRV